MGRRRGDRKLKQCPGCGTWQHTLRPCAKCGTVTVPEALDEPTSALAPYSTYLPATAGSENAPTRYVPPDLPLIPGMNNHREFIRVIACPTCGWRQVIHNRSPTCTPICPMCETSNRRAAEWTFVAGDLYDV